MKRVFLVVTALLLGYWWIAAAPPAHIRIADTVVFDNSTALAMAAVDRSADFVAAVERFPSALPGYDDMVFLTDGVTALATAMDGRIWKVDLRTHATEPFVDPPLMASAIPGPGGVYLAPFDPQHTGVVRLPYPKELQ